MQKGVRVMVFNTTFNNISVILWRSVLLAEEARGPGENHWQTLSNNVVSSTPHHEQGYKTTLGAIGTDCIGSCKSNYHTITTMTAPVDVGYLLWLTLPYCILSVSTQKYGSSKISVHLSSYVFSASQKLFLTHINKKN